MLSRLPRAALAAATLAAALPASAAAADYRLVYEGEVEYRHVRETEDGAYKEVETATFRVVGKAGGVELRRGRLLSSTMITNVRLSGARSSRVATNDGGNDKSCRGTSALSTAPTMLVPGFVYGAPASAAMLLPFLSAELFMVCENSEDETTDETLAISSVPPQRRRAAPSRFHVRIDMPAREPTGGRGFEWDLRRADTSLKNCPGGDWYTRFCRTSFDGTLRFLPVASGR